MIFLGDESVDYLIIQRLRTQGHDVLYVAEMDPGISDEFVLDEANRRNAVLITVDKDFGESSKASESLHGHALRAKANRALIARWLP